MTEPATAPGPRPSRRRRVGSVVLSAMGGGLGQIALGQWRRGALFYAACMASTVSAIGFALLGRGAPMYVAIACGLIVQLAYTVDAARVAPGPRVPRRRAVLLLIVGQCVFYNLAAGRARAGLVEAFKIPAGSMYPTLVIGDQMIVAKRPRRFERGDVVVFKYPLDPKVNYVKRVLAVGGDTIEIRADTVYVDGRPVERRRLDEPCEIEGPFDGVEGAPCALWQESLGGRTWRVSLEEGRLVWTWGNFRLPLEHFHYDTFAGRDEHMGPVRFVFALGGDGAVSTLRVVDALGVEFRRVREGRP